MRFDAILGQEPAVASLRRMLSGGRVPSALLFLGPHHVGKRTTALTLAKALNCRQDDGEACGACPSCRKIDEGVHPDVEVVAPDGQFIKIDQIRAVGDKLGLNPFEARKRVIILARAECLNPPAANAFLKTLEEPPGDTLIVLCAQGRGGLFETIVSRCMPLHFGLLPEPVLRHLLARQADDGGEELAFGVRFARGRLRPELREKLAAWMAIREELIEGLARPGPAGFPEISQAFAKWSASEDWRFVLEWLESWFRDLALLGAGAGEETLINADRAEGLRRGLGRFSPRAADACYRRVAATRHAMLLNVNKALALEALWLDCNRIARQGSEGATP